MDTILKPRHLCSTATDESSSEEDKDNDVVSFDKKDSSCSSTITVIPNCASIVNSQRTEGNGNKDDDDDENNEFEEGGSSGSKIVCPTARFLQVNPKKISSFDLLVRPPKRARFINHPSREDVSQAAAFKQKTKPVMMTMRPPINPTTVPCPRKKSPILESIYFENEKLRYRQTMSGNWSSSSSSASPRNQINAKSNGLKPMKAELQPEQFTKIYVNPESLPQQFSEENTLRDIELSEAYNQNIYCDGGLLGAASVEEEYTSVQVENFPEESQNASSIFRTCFEDQSSTFNEDVILDEKTGEFRVIHHPDLREVQSESTTILANGDCFQENIADENGNVGEFQEEEEYKEDDDHDNENDDHDNENDDHDNDNDDIMEFIEERPITALLPKEDSFDHLNGNMGSPLTIFLTGAMMGSGLDLGQDYNEMRFEMGSPFTTFGTECGDSCGEEEEELGDGELEGSRIEDVTDLVGDDEQVDSIIHLVRSGSGGDGEGGSMSEMKTIFWANSAPGSTSNRMDRVTSEPCQLIDGFRDKRRERGKKTFNSQELISISQNSYNFEEEIDAQEFLIQPKPKLNLSSSVHSAFERGNVEPTSTVAMFVEKKTKSDYFVGKIKGTSKTFLEPGFVSTNSNIKIDSDSDLSFNEDSKIDNNIIGNDDTTNSEDHSSLDNESPNEQQNLHKSSSALAIVVVNAKRKLSTGNRVSNAIPDKIQKKKGMSPQSPPTPPRRYQTATSNTYSSRRGENVQQLHFSRPSSSVKRSSSSSSHQQILMTVKAKSPTTNLTQQKNPTKIIENQKQKSILKKDKKPNFLMRIFGRLFGISTTSEKAKEQTTNRTRKIDDLIPSVPSTILKRSDRGIVHHTDSKELYRERRRKFFKEQKEFCDESLASYLEGMLSHENSSGGQDFVTIPNRIPLNYFLERSVMFPREALEDAVNNNNAHSSRAPDKNNNSFSPSTVPVPVRLARSESALTGAGGQGGGASGRQTRANLVLQFPPFVQVLAAGITRRRRSSLEDKSDFKRVKEELKKPLKGILKNPQN